MNTNIIRPSVKAAARKVRATAIGQRRATMTDIARIAGCSQATVSFVLNKAPDVKISDETRQRVIDAARHLNYAVTSLAHLEGAHATLRSEGRNVNFAAFVVDQLATSPEAVVAIEGARQALSANGRMMFIAQTMNDAKLEEKTVQSLVEKGANALIYMTIFTRRVTMPVWFDDLAVPVILLNCDFV